jgi:hypothetical protein
LNCSNCRFQRGVDMCSLLTWFPFMYSYFCSWEDFLTESTQPTPLSLFWDLCFPCKFRSLVGSLLKTNIRFPDFQRHLCSCLGFQPVRTSEHMASLGVFALLNAVAILRYLQSKLSSSEIKYVFTIGVLIAGAAVFCVVVLLTYAGVIAPWSGRYKNKTFMLLITN